eukprot:275418-Lingulodinium_polyedra.AAC.1
MCAGIGPAQGIWGPWPPAHLFCPPTHAGPRRAIQTGNQWPCLPPVLENSLNLIRLQRPQDLADQGQQGGE